MTENNYTTKTEYQFKKPGFYYYEKNVGQIFQLKNVSNWTSKK